MSDWWLGRISLAIRSNDENSRGQLQPAALILWDILLFCNSNCSETLLDSLTAFQRLLPSPLHNKFTPTLHTDHVEQDAQNDVDYLNLKRLLVPSKENPQAASSSMAAVLDSDHTAQQFIPCFDF